MQYSPVERGSFPCDFFYNDSFLLIICSFSSFIWQLHNKRTSFTLFCLHFNLSTVCFHNIICQAQSQSCSLSCGLCCKEWLKDFINYVFGNTIPVINNRDK